MLVSNKTNLLHSRLRHQEKPEFPRFSEPPFDFALYIDGVMLRLLFGNSVCEAARASPQPKGGARGGVFLIGRVARNRGEWPVARKEWPVKPEGAGSPRKAPNKANWNRPLVAYPQQVNVDVFGHLDAKQTQFRVAPGWDIEARTGPCATRERRR